MIRQFDPCANTSNLLISNASEFAPAASWAPKAIRSIFSTRAKRPWSRIAYAHASRTIFSNHRHHFPPPPLESRRRCSAIVEMALFPWHTYHHFRRVCWTYLELLLGVVLCLRYSMV